MGGQFIIKLVNELLGKLVCFAVSPGSPEGLIHQVQQALDGFNLLIFWLFGGFRPNQGLFYWLDRFQGYTPSNIDVPPRGFPVKKKRFLLAFFLLI